MKRLQLIMPKLEHKEILMDYRNEFIENKDSMDGCAGLLNAASYEKWYEAFKDNLNEETVREGLVPATTYIAIDKAGKLIGMIDIRHKLNDYLLKFGGHIGYSVRKCERRKGYATEMLKLALEKCAQLNIKEILITCDKENTASAHTILKNGGKLENEILENKEVTQRYWIKIN
ncbi:MAG: GNAT family N-acetyltransferase [Clostridium sp.]